MMGGVALGVLYSALLISDAEALTGPLGAGTFWLLHMLLSISVGIVFSALVAPSSFRRILLPAAAFLLVPVFLGGHAFVWLIGAAPIATDVHVAGDILGHLLFAVAMGISYVAFYRSEVQAARQAEAVDRKAWARSEEMVE